MLATMDFYCTARHTFCHWVAPPDEQTVGWHQRHPGCAGASWWWGLQVAGRAIASNILETLGAQKGSAVCPLNICMLIIGLSWLLLVGTSEASAPHGPCCTTLLVCSFGLSLHRVGQWVQEKCFHQWQHTSPGEVHVLAILKICKNCSDTTNNNPSLAVFHSHNLSKHHIKIIYPALITLSS